jgi:hypothetical protein
MEDPDGNVLQILTFKDIQRQTVNGAFVGQHDLFAKLLLAYL